MAEFDREKIEDILRMTLAFDAFSDQVIRSCLTEIDRLTALLAEREAEIVKLIRQLQLANKCVEQDGTEIADLHKDVRYWKDEAPS